VKVFVQKRGQMIEPFGEPAAAMQFGEGTVGHALARVVGRRGLELVYLEPDERADAGGDACVVLDESVYLSDKCLGDFLDVTFGQDRVFQLNLLRTAASDYVRPVSSISVFDVGDLKPDVNAKSRLSRFERDATERLSYDIFYVPKGKLPDVGGGELLRALRESAEPIVVEKQELAFTIRMPLLGDPEQTTMTYPISSTVAAHVEHWVHVLWLNHLAFGIRWLEVARAHKWWAAGRLLAAGLPFPMASYVPRVMQKMVRVGKNVRIHPTANVEASILGDNVVIGARASVRNSILGDGVEVGDHGSVIASTLGQRAFVTPKSFFIWSCAFEDAVVSNYKMQMSVLGRRASSSTWAGLIDAKFQGEITVKHQGELRSTERSFLGSCLGHGAHIGAKVLIHPGRAVPNETFIAMRPDELIQEIPDDLKPHTPVVRDAGTLIPLEEIVARAKAAQASAARPAKETASLPTTAG
jgi:carbonic anhydrase/acetyltransferase-like protein (isoleucine patch superfamily)